MNWNAKEFIWLDWVVLAIGIGLVAVAVYRSIMKDKRKMKGADSQDYLFGKGEPWWVIGAAIFAANIGSEHLVGLAGTGAKDGVGMAHWEMQGWMILILGWLFVPFYQLLNNKLGRIITMPEFLKFRYTKATGSWLSIITLVAYVLTKVSVIRWHEGRDDNVCHPDSYPDHRFFPCALPWLGYTGRRKHHSGLEQHDDLLQPSSQWLWHHTHVPLE